MPGRTPRSVAAGATQCPAVSTRSRASAVPVHRLPRVDTIMTICRPTAAVRTTVALPTRAITGGTKRSEKARARTGRRIIRLVEPVSAVFVNDVDHGSVRDVGSFLAVCFASLASYFGAGFGHLRAYWIAYGLGIGRRSKENDRPF